MKKTSIGGSQFQPLGVIPANWSSLDSILSQKVINSQEEQTTNRNDINYGNQFESVAICAYIQLSNQSQTHDQTPYQLTSNNSNASDSKMESFI